MTMPNQVGQINEQAGGGWDSRGEGSKDDDNDDVHGNVLRRRLGSSLSFFLFREGERKKRVYVHTQVRSRYQYLRE